MFTKRGVYQGLAVDFVLLLVIGHCLTGSYGHVQRPQEPITEYTHNEDYRGDSILRRAVNLTNTNRLDTENKNTSDASIAITSNKSAIIKTGTIKITTKLHTTTDAVALEAIEHSTSEPPHETTDKFDSSPTTITSHLTSLTSDFSTHSLNGPTTVTSTTHRSTSKSTSSSSFSSSVVTTPLSSSTSAIVTNSSSLPSTSKSATTATTRTTISSKRTISTPTHSTITASSTISSVDTKTTVSSMKSSGVSSTQSYSSVTSLTEAMSTSHSSNTTGHPGLGLEISPGLALGIVLVVCSFLAISGCVFFHLKQSRKKSYRPFTRQSCLACFKFTRTRTSSTGSHGPLNDDDLTSIDIPETNQDRTLFSIGDQDGGSDGRPSLRRDDAEDDYFYDEIFERSAFEDRHTIQSNKHLTLSADDDFDDELELPDLEFKMPSSR